MSSLEKRKTALDSGAQSYRLLSGELNANLGVPAPDPNGQLLLRANRRLDAKMGRDPFAPVAPQVTMGDTSGSKDRARDLYETAYLALNSRNPRDKRAAGAAVAELAKLDGEGNPEAHAALTVLKEEYGNAAVVTAPANGKAAQKNRFGLGL